MHPLDKEIIKALESEPQISGAARLLVVGGDDAVQRRIVSILDDQKFRVSCAASIEAARSDLTRKRFEVMLIEPDSLTGDWQKFLRDAHDACSHLKSLLVVTSESATRAVDAMRSGAIDCVDIKRESDILFARVESAVSRSRTEQKLQNKMTRLKKICRELNLVRHEVTDQVDSLCQELVTAYQDVADQVSEASMVTELRTLLRQELDIEELLRTTLEYLLTKSGPTNAAVFLPDGTGYYNLGAYVNYDCPRESISVLLDHMCSAICPQMESEHDLVRFDDADDFAEWIGMDPGILDDSQVIAFTCHRDGECLAVCVLFRSKSNPFTDELAGMLHLMRSIFAEQLSRVIRIHNRLEPQWPKEAVDDDGDDFGFGYGGGVAA